MIQIKWMLRNWWDVVCINFKALVSFVGKFLIEFLGGLDSGSFFWLASQTNFQKLKININIINFFLMLGLLAFETYDSNPSKWLEIHIFRRLIHVQTSIDQIQMNILAFIFLQSFRTILKKNFDKTFFEEFSLIN